MLNENIKTIRKSKGLSQEELAVKLNVVRQTISKWEQGLSVPDSDMLISISEALETPVCTLLGETVVEPKLDDLKVIFREIGDHKFTACPKEERETKNPFLAAALFVCGHNNDFCGLNSPKQSLFRLELQRRRNRRRGSRLSRV